MPDPKPSQPRRPTLVQTKIDVASPYHGWKLYFPDEGKSELDGKYSKTQILIIIVSLVGIIPKSF